jgi:MFS family permease
VKLPAPSEKGYGNYRWFVIILLWFICVLNYADRQAVFSIFSILQKEFGFSKKELGAIGSAFMIVYAVLSPLAGRFADRVNRKYLITGGLLVWSLFTGLTSFCSQFWQFLFVRGAEGLGETFYFPSSMSLISDYHSKRTRSRAMGFHHTGTYVGTIVGGILTGWLAQEYGWQKPFYIFGSLGVLFAAILVLFLREPQREESEKTLVPVGPPAPLLNVVKALAKNPPALMSLGAFFLANFVTLPFYAWLPTFIGEKFHVGVAQAAFVGTVFFQLSSSLGAAIGGTVADHWRKRSSGGRFYTQSLGVLCYAPFLYFTSRVENYFVVIGMMCLFGLFKGFYDSNVWASLYDIIPVEQRASACGLANTLAWTAGSISVFLVGVIVDSGKLDMSQTFQLSPLLNLIMVGLLFTAGRRANHFSLVQSTQGSKP